MQNQERNEQIEKSITAFFSPKEEPVMWGAALTSAVIVTLDYAEFAGHSVSTPALAVILAWVNILGLLIRSQYTPFAHRQEG